jgi:hypothetical protein
LEHCPTFSSALNRTPEGTTWRASMSAQQSEKGSAFAGRVPGGRGSAVARHHLSHQPNPKGGIRPMAKKAKKAAKKAKKAKKR